MQALLRLVYTQQSRQRTSMTFRSIEIEEAVPMKRIQAIEQQQIREDVPDFAVGDTVKVMYKVVEGQRERVQPFQGVVIRKHGAGNRETFTVRKVSFAVGVERTFPLHSPKIVDLDVVTRGHVRRSKLYYLRDKVGKAARIKEKSH